VGDPLLKEFFTSRPSEGRRAEETRRMILMVSSSGVGRWLRMVVLVGMLAMGLVPGWVAGGAQSGAAAREVWTARFAVATDSGENTPIADAQLNKTLSYDWAYLSRFFDMATSPNYIYACGAKMGPDAASAGFEVSRIKKSDGTVEGTHLFG